MIKAKLKLIGEENVHEDSEVESNIYEEFGEAMSELEFPVFGE